MRQPLVDSVNEHRARQKAASEADPEVGWLCAVSFFGMVMLVTV